jgi:hypothetical protein
MPTLLRLKMEVSFQPSTWDGRPSMELEYGRQRHVLGRVRMRDEVSQRPQKLPQRSCVFVSGRFILRAKQVKR